MEYCIRAENVTLDFQLRKPGVFDSAEPIVQEARNLKFRAVNEVTFQINEGDRVGLIGRNGAGKSTLLKLMSGILAPTSGVLVVRGKTFPLLNLSADILPQATLLQNIKLRGLLLGLQKNELKSYINVVRESAKLDTFLYSPVSTLSSGMKTRFLVSLIGSVHPELLIMDEWIGTTDKSFIEEKDSRLNQMIEHSKIFILASHNQSLIEKYCNKAMFVDNGKLKYFGSVSEAYSQFSKLTGV